MHATSRWLKPVDLPSENTDWIGGTQFHWTQELVETETTRVVAQSFRRDGRQRALGVSDDAQRLPVL